MLTGFFMQVGGVAHRPWAAARSDRALRSSTVTSCCCSCASSSPSLHRADRAAPAVGRRAGRARARRDPLAAIINWDLLAVALTAGSHARVVARAPRLGRRPARASPWRRSSTRCCCSARCSCSACARGHSGARSGSRPAGPSAAWLVVNLPVCLVNLDGWLEFYTFSSTRGDDWGSPWYVLQAGRAHPVPTAVNTVAIGLVPAALPRRRVARSLRRRSGPRFAQVAFLVIAAFCLTNKVYSPQYVLWLVPLAAMARPRWRDFLIWQAGEVVYFAAIWYFLAAYGTDDKGLPEGWYVVAIVRALLATAYFAAHGRARHPAPAARPGPHRRVRRARRRPGRRRPRRPGRAGWQSSRLAAGPSVAAATGG